MNKKGKGETVLYSILGVLVIAVVFGVLVMTGVLKTSQNAVTGQATGVASNPNVATNGQQACALAPSISSTFTDALSGGTSVTPTFKYRANGVYTTTAPTYSATVDLIANASGYLSAIKKSVSLSCGANLVAGQMYAFANVTPTVYSDNGLNTLDSAGTTNETAKSAGAAYNWRLHLVGTDKKSTGQMLVVIEGSTTQNASAITLSGGSATSAPVPSGYVGKITGGRVAAFMIPAIVNANTADYNVNIQSSTSKTVSGTVYMTIYELEPFVETDGTFNEGNAAYDSLGNAKYHDVVTINPIIA